MSDALGLNDAFALYWDDVEKCRAAGAYWCLLHVTVCLPDICAALQTESGDTKGQNEILYTKWCDEYLKEDQRLNGAERYQMRCKVLHQGRSTIEGSSRYTGFEFCQPSPKGIGAPRFVDASGRLYLDVGKLFYEMKRGVDLWIRDLEANRGGETARYVAKNLPTLVKVSALPVFGTPGRITVVGAGGPTRPTDQIQKTSTP